MPDLMPVIVIALAAFLLLTLRNARMALAAFLLQGLGIAWLVWVSPAPGAGTPPALVEIVSTAASTAVLALTIFRAGQPYGHAYPIDPAGSRAAGGGRGVGAWQPQALLLTAGLGALAGVAGYGLARVNPLGLNESDLLAFFWVTLAAVLMLTLDGARSIVKLSLGVLSLAHAAFLLVYTAGSGPVSTAVLVLGALVRIGIAMLASYLWLAASARYGTMNLNALFDSREGITYASTALAVAGSADQETNDAGAEPAAGENLKQEEQEDE